MLQLTIEGRRKLTALGEKESGELMHLLGIDR